MKKSIVVAALFAIGAFVWSSVTVLAADGATVFKEQKCYKCHGTEGQGNEDSGPKIKGGKFIMETPDTEIVNTIKNGRKGADKKYKDDNNQPKFKKNMPPFAEKLSDEEINAVIQFLKQS
jgi:mono/diheme cytochrome c family protein